VIFGEGLFGEFAASNAFLRDLVISAPVRQTIDNLIPSSQAIEALAARADLESRVRRRELLAHVEPGAEAFAA
jgi:hypothetical protein